MKAINRRHFLKTTALAAGALGALPQWTRGERQVFPNPHARARGANGDIRVAVIGLNGRGKDHIAGLGAVPGVRLVALCDVDSRVLEAETRKLKDKGQTVRPYSDIRKRRWYDSGKMEA